MNIRPFTDTDYATFAAIQNAALPENPVSEASLRHNDAQRPTIHRAGRFTVESDGEAIGVGEYGQSLVNFDPLVFFLTAFVLPEKQGQGVGSVLYAKLEREVIVLGAQSLRANAREDRAASVKFLQKRGFEERMRHWKSHLDVTRFDASSFEGVTKKVRDSGITIKTFTELKDEPDVLARLYDLTTAVVSDVPSLDPPQPIPYEKWLYFLKGPQFLPDAVFVAIDRATGAFVGFSNLFGSDAGNHLNTGLTGVLCEHRGRGIATALKLRAIDYAQSNDALEIHTSNESNNWAMLAINERLGFVKQPAEINFVKQLSA